MTEQDLMRLAVEMLDKAYVPYSHFPVGAALECGDGTVYTGCNIENAAFPCTICAERTAMFKAISEGHRSFHRIVIAGKSEDFCVPCGSCANTASWRSWMISVPASRHCPTCIASPFLC